MKKRIRTFAMTLAVMLAVTAGLPACGAKELTITLKDEFDWPELFVGQEYDVADIIEAEKKVTYSAEGYYLNLDFEEVPLVFNGTKFTQNEDFDTFVTITAKKGGRTGSKTVCLETQIDPDPMDVVAWRPVAHGIMRHCIVSVMTLPQARTFR